MSRINLGALVPRWEWRTFGSSFGETEEKIRRLPCSRIKESNEVYILSKNSYDNCKIRDSLIDIKVMISTDLRDIEKWKPYSKFAFPVGSAELSDVADVLKVSHFSSRPKYSIRQFLDEELPLHRDLKTVAVKKKRFGLNINGVEVEFAELLIEGEFVLTIGVEHNNPDAVVNLVHQLSLDHFENINYVRKLKSYLLMD